LVTLWHLLLSVCFFISFVGALDSAKLAKASYGGYALAIITGLAVGACCVSGMWYLGKIAVSRISTLEPGRLQRWSYRAVFFSAIFWIALAAILGRLLTSTLIRAI
jgi:hypothetical protein